MHYAVLNVTNNDLMQSDNQRHKLEYANRKEQLTGLFETEAAAIQYAQKLAQEKPTKQFAVLAPLAIFETAMPKVLKKKYNDQGELIIEESK